MKKLKSATKILSISDITICLFTIVLSFLCPVLVDDMDVPWDYLFWILFIFLILSLTSIVMFVVASIVCSISSKKIIKENSVIIAHIVNLAFIALLIYFIYDNDLGFIFC